MAPRRKLKGAQAELFAALCHHYINEAEEGNGKPDDVPIFSHLSRAQRLKLVADVAIGMLCEDEPLPPDTIQHNSAYRAMIEVLFTALEVEIDMQYDYDDDVGEDLLYYDEEDRGTPRTEEEMEENKVKEALIEHRAEKNMKKLKKGKDVGEFHVDKKMSTPGDMMSVHTDLMKIFAGGPVSKRERDSIRPLNEDEESAFMWRRLCDDALQEDTPNLHNFRDVFSLCNVNFDFRCQKLEKWYRALNLCFDTKLMDYGSATDNALIIGEVNYKSYADPSQLPRIKALERNINLLMKVYASSWDPKLLAFDERRIFAVCSDGLYFGHYQKKWVLGFVEECRARGIDFKEPGNYQARLDVFIDTKDDLMEGCEYAFGQFEHEELERVQRDWTPEEEGPTELGFVQRMCSGPGKSEYFTCCVETKNLQSCSRCRAVLCKFIACKSLCCTTKVSASKSKSLLLVFLFVADCGRECQVADWKRGHKNVCARLAKERKDKEKIAQMAKGDG